MKLNIIRLMIIIFILCLSGCSILSPVKQPRCIYVINSLPCPIIKYTNPKVSLFVTTVRAEPLYSTSQMIYSRCPYQIAYFAKNAWAESPPQMLQPLIVQALENTCHFHTVIASPAMGQFNYVLSSQLLDLRQVFTSCGSAVHLKFLAQLIKTSNYHVIATKEFCICVPAPCCNPYGGVIAANCATKILLEEIVRFCLANLP